MAMTDTFPWDNLPDSDQSVQYRASRVDSKHPWGFFWAKDVGGARLLILQHESKSCLPRKLPLLRGLEIEDSPSSEAGLHYLSLKLVNDVDDDIFYQLCIDIVERVRDAKSEKEAVSIAVGRSWRWHHLLRGGASSTLGPERQKGLIGELRVLERYLLPNMPGAAAVQAWQGPFDAPKDFQIDRIAIEAKARQGASSPYVSISSENQLDTSGVDFLYLHVVELDSASPDAPDSFILTDLVEDLLAVIEINDPSAIEAFEGALAAVGYRQEDDYSDYRWLEGKSRVFEVVSSFPRVSADQIVAGVSMVTYRISLVDCASFEIESSTVTGKLGKQ